MGERGEYVIELDRLASHSDVQEGNGVACFARFFCCLWPSL